MKTDFKKFDMGIFIVIIIVIICQLVKLGDYPGLYLDAINPDYIGIQLLYPQTLETKWQIAWPWLCQIYHGNNGMIITMLSTMITGRVSVLQYHITYGIVAAIAVFLTYCVLTHKRVGVSKIWAGIGSIVLISWPSLFTIIITQFYMCLFGSACVLGGILLFLNWLDDINKYWNICLCYILFGLAFYSYFNFVFFVPTLIICTAYALKKARNLTFDTIVTPLIAYLIGCGLFIVGWSQIALWTGGVEMTVTLKTWLFIVVYALIILALIAFCNKWRGRKIILGAYLVGGIIWAIQILPSIKNSASGLGIVEYTSLSQKIAAVIGDYSYILTGKNSEGMIFGTQVTVFNGYVLGAFVAVVVVTLLLEMLRRQYSKAWKIPVMTVVVYLCCCVALGTRMQPQHYVPLVFITYLGFCLCTKSIFESIENIGVAPAKWVVIHKNLLLGILGGCLVFLNLFNEARIINEIRVTGGENYWASEINELADEALENKENGIKEVYIFEDWGFFTGFNYLTMNNIPYVTSVDEALLSQYYSDGNDIVVCYWNEEDASTYEQLYDKINDGNGAITIEEWVDNNGKTEFYEMRLSSGNDEVAANE